MDLNANVIIVICNSFLYETQRLDYVSNEVFLFLIQIYIKENVTVNPLNLMNFTLSKHQVRKLATKVKIVKKRSFEIRTRIIFILLKCSFEISLEIMMVLQGETAKLRIFILQNLTIRLSIQSFEHFLI